MNWEAAGGGLIPGRRSFVTQELFWVWRFGGTFCHLKDKGQIIPPGAERFLRGLLHLGDGCETLKRLRAPVVWFRPSSGGARPALRGCTTRRRESQTVQAALPATAIKRECETSHLVYKYTHARTPLCFGFLLAQSLHFAVRDDRGYVRRR